MPRTLLLTRWAPDARFAGGEVQRKLVGHMPVESLRWAYLNPCERPEDISARSTRIAFPLKWVHWRLRRTGLQYLWAHVQSAGLARQIAEWGKEFVPQVVWIASDLEGITVGRLVAKRLGLPIHLTVYDAFEWCRKCGVPSWYTALYYPELRRCLREVCTLDAVSQELLEHVCRGYTMPKLRCGMVLRPSLDAAWAAKLPPLQPDFSPCAPRRIGFCGASRVDDAQWNTFVSRLGRLPWPVELHVFADPLDFHNASLPPGVTVRYRKYLASEQDMIRELRAAALHATYLGLWHDETKRFFVRTSLSSKLTAYAGIGAPVIADLPEDSAAWRLLNRYEAGVLLPEAEGDADCALRRVLGDKIAWERLADGVARLRDREYDINYNVACLQDVLAVCAEKR